MSCRKDGGFSISTRVEALERLASSFQNEDHPRIWLIETKWEVKVWVILNFRSLWMFKAKQGWSGNGSMLLGKSLYQVGWLRVMWRLVTKIGCWSDLQGRQTSGTGSPQTL